MKFREAGAARIDVKCEPSVDKVSFGPFITRSS